MSEEEKITYADLMTSLNNCVCLCRPDEYQQRHNLLTRQLAAFLLAEEINNCEGEIE